MLTKKQRDLLMYIHTHMSGDDVAPSFEEMKDALGLKSKSGIHRLITGLVERGYVERLPHRARALAIRRLPDGFTLQAVAAKPSQTKEVTKQAARISQASNDLLEIPLYGKIAAGTPIEAIQHDGPVVMTTPDMIGAGEHYALTIEGDSMINAGIHNGDTVIIQRCQNAENGTIVVALVDDAEATLKRLRRAGNKIILEPENDTYEPQVLDPGRVKIQGRLVSLMRRYH